MRKSKPFTCQTNSTPIAQSERMPTEVMRQDFNSENLLPCPFCGSRRVNMEMQYVPNIGLTFRIVRCQNCKANSGLKVSNESAADSWNSRNEAR